MLNVEKWASAFDTLEDKNIILIVTGGIAAYKTVELARLLTKHKAKVRVVMTEAARHFVTPLTFETLTNQPVCYDQWQRNHPHEIEHISWADWADLLIVAPATANFIAKMAHGLADDFASTLNLAFSGPKLLAPAMNTQMYNNPATQNNLKLLESYGVEIADSPEGLMACGTSGKGRLADIEIIALLAARKLTKHDLKSKIIISAGSTREIWDDIRFLSNRSTGLMGQHLALAAWLRGGEVSLVNGGGALPFKYLLPNFKVTLAERTIDMLEVIKKEIASSEYLIMSAAPADFRPEEIVKGKIKKNTNISTLKLATNPDILKNLAENKGHRKFIGFAAEEFELIANGQKKLKEKSLDLIVANQAGGDHSAFGSTHNHLWIINKNGDTLELDRRPKFAAAWAIIDEAIKL